jgi:phospholipid/cholesterol/gamma-HCH transport system substrate-binding protein
MKKFATETTVGIFVVFGLAMVAYMTIALGHVSFLADETYPLSASFASVTGLRKGSPVYMLGLKIGHAEELSIDQKNLKAVVKIKVNKGIQIYDDAIASIKTEGLIGDSYLSIDPGGSGELLKSGGVIIETHPPLDIADLIGKYAFGDVKKQ